MRFLRDTGLEGHLFNAFNLGGFLGYWVSPRLRTFIDGRLDHYPPEVLDDYLAIRRTSLRGPSERLRALLDARKVDVFFADHFPEREYRNRFSGTHLRRLPDWVPVFAARTHSIYLRRSPENRDNLRRVAAFYRERGVPFDPREGLDVDCAGVFGRALRYRPVIDASESSTVSRSPSARTSPPRSPASGPMSMM